MICVDDFAFRKRYSYGSVMVDLETHRIIDIIDSRETTAVAEWLKTYPNLSVISRDGAQAYASASLNSHPEVVQISDRFHLLKNLSEAVEKYMRRLFPSRLEIPATSATQSPEMQALYNIHAIVLNELDLLDQNVMKVIHLMISHYYYIRQ